MRDLSMLKVGDKVKTKIADDMCYDHGRNITMGEALAQGKVSIGQYNDCARFANTWLTVRNISLTTFCVDEVSGFSFFAEDIAIWPNESNINMTDILEFIGV